MATINLGRIKPVFKGAYASGTAYVVDDIVVYSDESYICIQAGTGQTPSSATAYWTKMAAKGTDGTNVATTLTTQGDILYRDGSGLQRLPKGTAGQVLKMNSSANAPEYGTLSSDYVKIAQTIITSSTASVTFQHGSGGVVIDSTYKNYVVVAQNGYPATQGDTLRMRIGVGGTIRTTGYFQDAFRSYYSGGTTRDARTDCIFSPQGGIEHSVNGDAFFEATLNNLSDANFKSACVGLASYVDGDGSATNQVNHGHSGGIYGTAEANDTINIYYGGGNILKGTFTLYGRK